MEPRARSKSPKPKSPKSKRAAIMRQLRKMNEEQLRAAILKKKECNAKAAKIVEKLLDPIEDEKDLLKVLPDINQEHYQDIVEERAIMKICGFPLCKEQLGEIPKQKYHISSSSTKIYDLTERKHFCSGKCFKSSNYLKMQLLTSPLWLRDQEEIPEFKLLSLN
ncbi:hypothetical protein PVAND_006195 [Polypedilum vanderplanki]|uniref:RNA polymerase II subunit B1 CTD phosphatase RPAP2 homolog n=1 Tax=Polypedilum vanderplanki TaxID=319348 RepID=A0A9J6C2E7_POLVA|nr:hypothetical protein PVAND_006195 [Polypedilum vanderplanki]